MKAMVEATSSNTKKIFLSFLLIIAQAMPPMNTPADQRMVTRTAYEPRSRVIR